MSETIAEISLSTCDLTGDIGFFTKTCGFRMETIFPADDPAVAVFSGHGLRLRLVRAKDAPPQSGGAAIRILTDRPDDFAKARALVSPGGTRVEIAPRDPPLVLPPTQHQFVVRRLADQAPWVIGRAGMHYRDLIPDRLGGSIIASHIRIPDGGPVPDMVHYHKVGFQLIFCIKGWVDVVYEDQGGPIRLTAGDCFIQPPEIRHRVLEASDGIEVIEIGVPADHVTAIDHDMTLPTPHLRPEREWAGQRFVHNTAQGAIWQPFRLPGFVARDTTIAHNTQGVAGVQVARPDGSPTVWATHDSDILFTYVMRGSMRLDSAVSGPHLLQEGDAFVIPPRLKTRYADPSADLELLEVALPGRFTTQQEVSG